MICPRCSVGEISEATQECLVCGFSRTGGVLVESSDWSALDDPVLPSLERQFQVEGVLRRGAASRIYLARDQVTGRLCSLKVIPLADSTTATVDQFRKDAQRSAALDHPHIVAVSSFGATSDAVWFAMEYVQGRSLGDLLRTADRMDLKTCLRLVEQISSALEYGHRRGITHGNLKPSNVLVDPEGWARVADFGLSAAFGTLPRRQPEQSFEENFGHVAPERFGSAGEAGPAADQYALAVLAFSCLARRPPIVGETMDEIARHHLEGPPPRLGETRPDLPPHVATTLARAMSRRPENRFASVLDFVTALAGVSLPEPLPVAAIPVATGPVLVKDTKDTKQDEELPELRPSALAPPPPPPHATPALTPPPADAPPAPAKPEPVVAAASPDAPTAEATHPPLLLVERGGGSRGPHPARDDEEDEDEVREKTRVAQAKLVRDDDDDDDDDDAEENPDEATREPVLLWPAREHAPDAASGAAPESIAAQKSEEERALLFLEEARPNRSAGVERAVARLRHFANRWRSLPKRVRTRSGVGAAAAVLVMAVVAWRVARGHEEVRPPDWRGERAPVGLVDTPASQSKTSPTRPRNGTNPATRRSNPTTRPTTTPGTVATADTGGGRVRPPVTASNDPAHLYINATPWGLLFIDDRPMGNTPRADLQIPPGMHRIRITRDGYLPYETEIAIEAGETLRLTDIVLQEKPQ